MKKMYENYECTINDCSSETKCAEVKVLLNSRKSEYPDLKCSADAFLRLVVGQFIDCGDGKRMEVIHLNKVNIWDGDNILVTLHGFHTIREDVRSYLNENKLLNDDIEKINREIANVEFLEYIASADDKIIACENYFIERFPQAAKETYLNSIGCMFCEYEDFFSRPEISKAINSGIKMIDPNKVELIFRTKKDKNGETHSYPLKIKLDLTEFMSKFMICFHNEMKPIH